MIYYVSFVSPFPAHTSCTKPTYMRNLSDGRVSAGSIPPAVLLRVCTFYDTTFFVGVPALGSLQFLAAAAQQE
jgi:hypothetical protein